ncbi:MAG TPA: hypothetical protein PLN56_10910 [Methanoregulaceae archaeon]|nr:hypothetical protein [Methanoregulaceae archaeon]
MVNQNAQIYTIEGISASILMIMTAYLIISSSSVVTPQETHINDMQLEQVGHDALVVINTPREKGVQSILYECIKNDPVPHPGSNADFNNYFNQLLNSRTFSENDTLHFKIQLYYRDRISGEIQPPIDFTSDNTAYLRDDAVKVTQWVKMGNDAIDPDLRDKIILVEALIWRS